MVWRGIKQVKKEYFEDSQLHIYFIITGMARYYKIPT